MKYYGHIFTGSGYKADPKKIEDVVSAPAPTNTAEMKSFLGMAQYLARFIPDYATRTRPLRVLTHQDVKWNWGEFEETAFQKLKTALVSSEVMTYYDPNKSSKILVDASPVGLSAILTQDGKILAYGSRALSDVESRYSQTEREMLAVVWGAEYYHVYVFGSQFTIVTDHKPLLGIFKSHKPISARMERWRLRLTPYIYDLIYSPGEDNPADFLSRHPRKNAPEDTVAEQYVNYIFKNAVPKAMTEAEIALESENDEVIQQLKKAIQSEQDNLWKNPILKDYTNVRNELTVVGDVVLRDNRIVMPSKLQQKAIDLAHSSHQGIVKTKSLIREKTWFPGIDKRVEERVKQCMPCQAATPNKEHIEPLTMTELPESSWSQVAIDFKGPLPNGDYYLVVYDMYSRYPEVEVLKSTSASETIPKLDAIFARQGIPKMVRTDNGPPFNSHEFADYAEYAGFEHQRITPLWPRANGEAERFMRTLTKATTTAVVEGRNTKQALHEFLRQYRATPHSTTGLSPCELLNGRKLRTRLSTIDETAREQCPKTIKERDTEQKVKMKAHADKVLHTKPSDIAVGDCVLVKQKKKNAFSTPFNPKPYTVTWRNGNSVVAERGERTIRRNVSFFKKVMVNNGEHQAYNNGESQSDDELDNDEDVAAHDQAGPQAEQDPPQARPQRDRRMPQYLNDYLH